MGTRDRVRQDLIKAGAVKPVRNLGRKKTNESSVIRSIIRAAGKSPNAALQAEN